MTTHDGTFEQGERSGDRPTDAEDAPEASDKSTAPDVGRSTTGLEPNVAATLAYAVGWASGLALWLIERDSPFVKFHAIQSTVFFGGLHVLSVLLFKVMMPLSIFGGFLVAPVLVVIWLVLMFKAYKGERFQLPYIGPWSDERARLP